MNRDSLALSAFSVEHVAVRRRTMNTGYILIACGFVGLAIALNLGSGAPGGMRRAAMAFRA